MATQDKLITGLTNLMAAIDMPDHRRQEIINYAVNFSGTMYWEGVDEGKRRGFTAGYINGYEVGMLDAVEKYESF